MPCYKIKNAPMTLWDAKEAMGGPHGYLPGRPWGGKGHPQYPELWPDEVAKEKGTILGADGGDGWMCGELGPHCYEPGCGTMSDLLCDWPMGRGKTCDLPMCEGHAREIGIDRHLCIIHHGMWQAQSAPVGGNKWPPKP